MTRKRALCFETSGQSNFGKHWMTQTPSTEFWQSKEFVRFKCFLNREVPCRHFVFIIVCSELSVVQFELLLETIAILVHSSKMINNALETPSQITTC